MLWWNKINEIWITIEITTFDSLGKVGTDKVEEPSDVTGNSPNGFEESKPKHPI